MILESPKTVIVVGEVEPHLVELFSDLLRDLGLTIGNATHAPPRFAIAIVRSASLTRVLGEALAAARGAPVIAVLPLGHHRASMALECGAFGVFELGASTDELRKLLAAASREGEFARISVRLGENAMTAVRILRGNRRRSQLAFPEDAERELEIALHVDRVRDYAPAIRLGPAALAELRRWNASDTERALLEAALQKDARVAR